jgi:hypothetical protein
MFDYEFLLALLIVFLPWLSGYIMSTGFAD